jgi:hypothetical protein
MIYFNQKRFSEAKNEAWTIINQEPDNKVAREILKKISE